MIVVRPQTVDDTILDSSSIPEPDGSQGEITWTPGTYNLGVQRINTTTHKVYEVVAAPSTSDDPLVGINADPATWIEIGPTNKYKMFDEVVSTESIASSPLTFDITPGRNYNSVAGFNINADTINITVNDPTDGEVYNTDIDMNDYDAIVDFYEYFFEPIAKIDEFALFDLPAYPASTMTFTATSAGSIEVGAFVIGQKFDIGTAVLGTSVQSYDPSIRQRDEFGNFTIIPRNTSDIVDFDFFIPRNRIKPARKLLKTLTTIPTVWADTGAVDDPTLEYGYYKDFRIIIDQPTVCTGTVQVEGLV